MSSLRELPSVDQLLRTRKSAEMIALNGRPLTLEAIRSVLEDIRERAAKDKTLPDNDNILNLIQARLCAWTTPSLLPVINATGVILHTNLGRAPLSQSALDAIHATAGGYTNLEYDLAGGSRGSRTTHASALLQRITGAEAALVVNNNAAAVLLVLTALARRRRVIVSRSQLVEIGGGFRVPDVMKQSGAVLVEVGTTNRTHLSDYQEALAEPARMILRTHTSNFKIIGFTSEPALAEISELARRIGVAVVEDLGSGALLDTARFGLGHEPTVQESLKDGSDLVCFSGDKLLGGPQAGIIVGKAELMDKIKRHPLARALRADKLCLAGLSATLMHYLRDEAERKIPVWQMISAQPKQMYARAQRWMQELGTGKLVEGNSTVGGGSLPEEELPTWLLSLRVKQPNQFLAKLRTSSPSVIARVENEEVVFDPRTVLPEQEGAFLVCLQNALGKHQD